jgi:Tfp pilus assembly protein PilN
LSQKKTSPVTAVLEWSPREVVVFDVKSGESREYANAEEASRVTGSRTVVVAVSRRSLFVRTMRVPNASASDVDMIVRMKLGELFPLPAQDLAVDVELTADLNAEGRLALIVAMPTLELKRLNDEVGAAGFKILRVVPAAYGSVLLANTLGKKNVAVVSRDETLIGIDIVLDGILRYSRVAAPGPSAAAEVCRTYSVAGIPCGEIIAMESVAIEEADLKTPASPLEPLTQIAPEQMAFSLELPSVVAARKLRSQTSRRWFAGVMLAAASGFGAFVFMDFTQAVNQVSAQQAINAKKISKAQAAESDTASRAKLYVGSTDKKPPTMGFQGYVQRAFQPGQKLSDVAELMANDVPEGAWLTGLTIERGKELMVRGVAKDGNAVDTYLNKLTSEDRLRDVTLVFANNAVINQIPVVQFSFSAFPVGNLPLVDLKRGGPQ